MKPRAVAGLFYWRRASLPAVCRIFPLRPFACKVALLLLALARISIATADPAIMSFSAGVPGAMLPMPWRIATLPGGKRPTRFDLVADGGTVVLRAEAHASVASLVHPLAFDPKAFPFVGWRWKISNILRKSDIHSKAGDDFPARVYVLFDYDVSKLSMLQRAKIFVARQRFGKEVPAAALCYVWDGKAPAGTTAWSPYSDRVRVIVVESGSANVNRWREVQRDIVADFRTAFGEDPPAISAVALASDTDNTGESVTTLFGDIHFSAKPQEIR